AEISSNATDETRAVVLERVADLRQNHLNDSDGAAARYEELLELKPGHRAALETLEAYYADSDAPEDRARVLRMRLAATADPQERVATLYRLADLHLEVDAASPDGVEALRDVLGVDATQSPAKKRLAKLYKSAKQWPELAEVYGWQLDDTPSAEDRIDLLQQLANVQEKHLDQSRDAVATFREVLELSPQSILAITSLERLCPELEDYEGLLAVLEQKRELFRNPIDRAGVDFQMGELIYERLGQPERALDQLRLVLVHDPDHSDAVATLVKMLEEPSIRLAVTFILEPIFGREERFRDLVGLLDIQIEESEDPEEQVELLRRLAEVRENELGDADGAMDALGVAFQLFPLDESIRASLEETAERGDAFAKLADIYQQALGTAADAELTRALSGWLAVLADERLNDPEGAIDRYRDVLAYDEFNFAALSALGRLLERTERWDELADVLRREMAHAPAGRQAVLRRELASVLCDRLDNPEAAMELYKEMVWADSSDAVGLSGLANIAKAHPLLREDVTSVLLPVHQSAERWSDVVELLLLSIDEDSPDSDRATIHKRVAEVYENHLSDATSAYEHYRRALDADPARSDVLARMEVLARQEERWDDLLDVYEALADHSTAPDEQTTLLFKAASIARENLDQVDFAEELYRRILTVDSEHYDALGALESLYESQGKVLELIEICEAKAELPISVRERAVLYRKIARAAHVRADAEKEVSAWERLADIDARDSEALVALERLYRQSGDFERLATTMERRGRALENSAELVAVKVELGRLRRDRVGDVAGAIEAFEEALELDEAEPEALLALSELYEVSARWSDLADVLEARVELAESADDQLSLRRRLAVIAEGHLENIDVAVRHYEAIAELDPSDEATVDELIRIYHHHERYEGLCNAYQRKVELSSDPLRKTALKVKAAEIYEEHLGRPDRASALAGEVLELDPTNRGALMMRARLLQSEGDVEGAIAAYEALLPQLETAREQVRVQLNLGKLYLGRDNTSKALASFRDVLGTDPDHAEAAVLLKQVLYKRESWEALVPVLEKEVHRLRDPRPKAELAREIASILRDKMGQPEEGYRWLREAYGARRDHPGVVSDLIDYYVSVGREADGVPLLGWLVSYLEAKRRFPELAVQAFRLGELYESIDELERALANYQVAAQADSRHVPSMLALGRLYLAADRPDKALATLQSLLMLQHEIDDDTVRAEMFLHLTKACLATGDGAKAKRHLKRLRSLEPDHPELAALDKQI
ncbi:MAG: tetratricopeptide (TPR) repeat protein, partial [Myxococcota bacterium]